MTRKGKGEKSSATADDEAAEPRAEELELGAGVFLTPYELSKRWNWSVRERTLRNWRATGFGPKFVTVAGQRILYRVTDVEAYERAREGRILPGT